MENQSMVVVEEKVRKTETCEKKLNTFQRNRNIHRVLAYNFYNFIFLNFFLYESFKRKSVNVITYFKYFVIVVSNL